MENHHSAQFEGVSHFLKFFLAYSCIAMLSCGLNVLGLCEGIAGLSHSETGGAQEASQEEDGMRSLACAEWK